MTHATMMPTPYGPMPIRREISAKFPFLSDREIADQVFAGPFIDPEYYAELLARGLSGPGMFQADTYKLIEAREDQRESLPP